MASLNRARKIEIVGADPGTITATDKSNLITTITGQLVGGITAIFGRPAPVSGGGSATPPWLLPTIIGGVGVLSLVMFATK